MDVFLLILQACTLGVSLFSVTLTFLLGRGTNKISTVFKQRALNKAKVQCAAAVLLKYTMKDVLPLVDKEDVFKTAEAAGIISSVLKYRYSIADHIIELSNKLVADLAEYVASDKKDAGAILDTRREFFEAYSKYDMAEWRFLKRQANGETRGTEDYDKVYSIVVEEFKRADEKKKENA